MLAADMALIAGGPTLHERPALHARSTERPVAYVMEQTLGNITHYLNLRRAESMAAPPGVRWLPIDYAGSRVPWTITGGRLARKALADVLPEVDGIFMHTTTLALMCVDLFRNKPTVLSTDGTPANKRKMRSAYGLAEQGKLRERAKRALYAKVYGTATGLVGWSNWVKQSFVEDYGFPESDVAVIPPGVDVDQFVAGDRNHELPRILFVGGDFERKGGVLLLDVFRQRLRGRAELILVTRDKVEAEPGVTVHRNVSANSPKCCSCTQHPTCSRFPRWPTLSHWSRWRRWRQACRSSQTRVGGIPDIVLDGKTGYLLEAGDSAALGDAIEALVTDVGRRRTMGELGRADALQRFNARENARRLFEFVRSRC